MAAVAHASHFEHELAVVCLKLRRRQLTGVHTISTRTAELMRHIVANSRWQDPEQLISRIQDIGAKLVLAAPHELCIGNIVRRVLRIVRDEVEGLQRERAEETGAADAPHVGTFGPSMTTPALHNLLAAGTLPEPGVPTQERAINPQEIKQPIIDGCTDILDELKTMVVNIAAQALEHVHAREVILTCGESRIVEAFLKRVHKEGREFEVVVADTAPMYNGAETARRLAEAGINTILITDAAVFALMARVNKVIVGTYAVMADGGLLAPAGLHAIALAARHHSVPFVVCAGIPQLTPIFATDPDDFNVLRAPSPVLSYEDTALLDVDATLPEDEAAVRREGHAADSPNPVYDCVPPDIISLFITNIGGTHASYIYRLLAELYSPHDIQLRSLNPTQM